ncbi:hypothetical protein AB0K23_19540 [Streptomyces sp. NPDC049602]|uniref:hypothetical protein n=1 Tax=Streptomyces sp. NPDC049602 TaxID=3155504 RepID=UPI00342FD36B
MYVQSLPDAASFKPLGEHAADLGLRPRAYHRAKECLIQNGYLHEWKWQSERGYWTTEQLVSNVTLTRDEANSLRAGIPPESPSPRERAAGSPGGRNSGTSFGKAKDSKSKTSPHPPTKAQPQEPEPEEPEGSESEAPDAEPELPEVTPEADTAPEADAAPEVAVAERLLLSLRHQNRDLLLGVREARGLAEAAAEWLRRGVSAADLRHALTAHLPRNGVRSAVGFLRHRLTEKLPAPLPPQVPEERPAEVVRQGLVTCEGFGDEHVFRPVGDETHCGACRMEAARRAHGVGPRKAASRPSWRTLVDQVTAADGLS